jgi:hypothetical protein
VDGEINGEPSLGAALWIENDTMTSVHVTELEYHKVLDEAILAQ